MVTEIDQVRVKYAQLEHAAPLIPNFNFDFNFDYRMIYFY